MVTVNAYTRHEWATGTSTETLYGTGLNWNFDYVSALVNKGVTGANIATNGIDSEALFAGSVITEGAIDYGTGDGMGVVQIGKDRTTTGGQMLVKGTAAVASVTGAGTTNTDITVYFTNGDVCTAGDPGFTASPHIGCVYIVTANTEVVYTRKAVATDSCQINIAATDTVLLGVDNTLYWEAIGDV